MSSTPMVSHLRTIQLGSASCACFQPRLAPALSRVLTETDLQEMRSFHQEHVPKRPWWSFLSLWSAALCVIVPVVLRAVFPNVLVVAIAYGVVMVLLIAAVISDTAISAYRARCHRPAVLAQLQHLNSDWRVRRGFQLLLRGSGDGMQFMVELGRGYREPLEQVDLVPGFGKETRFSSEYSLAVEELCGADYAAKHFSIDVQQLNNVPGPRLFALGVVLNLLAPFVVLGLYFGVVGVLSAKAPNSAAFDAMLSFPAILAAVACSIASIPLVSVVRRLESNRFLREMALAVEQLQQCRGGCASGEWRWRFVGPENMFERPGMSERAKSAARMMRGFTRVSDAFMHKRPSYTVQIVSGKQCPHEGKTEMDTLL
jgi:hypothetical protein